MMGKKLYSKNCSQCHGPSGEGLYAPELVGKGKLVGNEVSKTVGNFWPYAPKIFDYLKRAKRKENETFFSDEGDLFHNGIYIKFKWFIFCQKINKKLLSEIIMPNRENFISDYY